MWLRTGMVMWKEFIQISRDPRMLIVAVIMPLFMLLLYGYAINLDVRHLRVAIYDQDRSQASRELIEAFSHTDYFDLVAFAESPREVVRLLDSGQARVVLTIPVGFARDLAAGRGVPVQALVDGSDSTTASTGVGYLAGVLQQHSVKLTLHALEAQGVIARGEIEPVELRTRFWYNPELRSTNFLVPGLLAVIQMVLAALLTSVTVVRERERGTIEQLVVSPIRPLELMIGKLLPYVVIAFADVLLILLAGVYIFRIPFRGDPFLVLLCSAFFLLAALGIGLFISTVAPNQQVAMVGAMMATQLPTVLLSGFIFPVTSMPLAVQVITLIIPARHYIYILRGIILKGNDFSHVWVPALALLTLGLTMLAISSVRFKKKL